MQSLQEKLTKMRKIMGGGIKIEQNIWGRWGSLQKSNDPIQDELAKLERRLEAARMLREDEYGKDGLRRQDSV